MKNEETIHQEMAELKLENRLLSERLTMCNHALNVRTEERMFICEQLDKWGFLLTGDNHITKKSI